MVLKAVARNKKLGLELRIYFAGRMQYVVTDKDDIALATFQNLMEASRFCTQRVYYANLPAINQ